LKRPAVDVPRPREQAYSRTITIKKQAESYTAETQPKWRPATMFQSGYATREVDLKVIVARLPEQGDDFDLNSSPEPISMLKKLSQQARGKKEREEKDRKEKNRKEEEDG